MAEQKPGATVLTVLNVNDDDANRYAVTRMLRLGGYEVSEAATGQEALDKIRETHPDVVILDVNLPDISGHEVCARVKADPDTARVAVLQLSAISIRSADKVTGLDSGADGYLTMPVETPELLATVRALLRVRRAEDEARRTSARWKQTFDAISDGVALLDTDGQIVQMNRAMEQIAGALPDGGATYHDVFGPALDIHDGSLDELFTATNRQLREVARGERWLRIVSDPVIDDNRPSGRVLTITDLTDRRRLEDELRQHVTLLAENDRRKDEFLAMLGHELRNPLSAISAALYQLNQRDSVADPEWLRDVASRQVDQLARLVDDLLDVSRITRGKVQLQTRVLDLRQVVANVHRAIQSAVDARRQHLEVSVADEPLVLLGDQARLEQIVSNLLTNAIKYTPEGGSLRLVAEGTPSEVIVRVSDTGVGIDETLLPKIFDLFTQGDQSIDRPVGGLGVGLTIVRTLVQLHRGSIQVSSDGQGRGSEFTVRFPRSSAEVEEARDTRWTQPVESSEQTFDIVVAEDNADVRDLMTQMLTRRGHRVRTASDGLTAVEIILAAPPEVALVDLGLPGIDGYEVARRLRSQASTVRLIAVSGYGREEDLEKSRNAGFEAHLVKPVRPAELFSTLANG